MVQLLSFFLRVGDEAIADAAHRLQVNRVHGIIFKVAPESDDEVVDRARIRVLMQMPDLIQNFAARNGAARVGNKIAQQFDLHHGEANLFIGRAYFQQAKIDRFAGERIFIRCRQLLLCFLRAKPAGATKQSIQASQKNRQLEGLGR